MRKILFSASVGWLAATSVYASDLLAQYNRGGLYDLNPQDPLQILYTEIRCASLFANTQVVAAHLKLDAEVSSSKFKEEQFMELIRVHPLLPPELDLGKLFRDQRTAYLDRWDEHAGRDGNFFDKTTEIDFDVCNYLLKEKYEELFDLGYSKGNRSPDNE